MPHEIQKVRQEESGAKKQLSQEENATRFLVGGRITQ